MRFTVFLYLPLLSLFLLFMPERSSAAEKVSLITYHQDPPFIVLAEEKIGLSFDLINYLNQYEPERFQFELRTLPRIRLNAHIDRNDPGVVPWVNNAWFQDINESKYLWTKGFSNDGDVVIVRKDSEIVYKTPHSLIGKTIASVRGFRFTGIDQLTSSGQIQRLDTNTVEQCLKMLEAGRVDAVIAPKSATLYSIKAAGLEDRLRIEPKYHSQYERKFMVLQKRRDLKDFLNRVVQKMSTDPDWQITLNKYN